MRILYLAVFVALYVALATGAGYVVAAMPAEAQTRAPAGTFPPWEIVCVDSYGTEMYRQGLRAYPVNDSLDGYVLLSLWRPNDKRIINYTNCEIIDNRSRYR